MTEVTRAGTRDASSGEMVGQAVEQLSRLVRDELALARAEMTEKGRRAGLGVGLFGGGGLVALYGVAALLAAVVLVLAEVMPAWVAALIVAAVLLAAAGVLALAGRGQVRQATPLVPAETARSVKADIEKVKEKARR